MFSFPKLELSITLWFLNSFLKVVSIFQYRFAEALNLSWVKSIETTLCHLIWDSFWLMDLNEVIKMLSQLSPENLGSNLAPPESKWTVYWILNTLTLISYTLGSNDANSLETDCGIHLLEKVLHEIYFTTIALSLTYSLEGRLLRLWSVHNYRTLRKNRLTGTFSVRIQISVWDRDSFLLMTLVRI